MMLYTILQPTFSPIKRYQDILFKLLTLNTDFVTKKITGVRTVYFYNSGSIFATKIFVTESVLKVRSFMSRPISWHRSIGKMWAAKCCITFWVKMKKHGKFSTYFHLKHHCGKEVGHFPYSVSKQKPHDYPPCILTQRHDEPFCGNFVEKY